MTLNCYKFDFWRILRDVDYLARLLFVRLMDSRSTRSLIGNELWNFFPTYLPYVELELSLQGSFVP